MIKLEVEGYCHDCLDFTPDVTKPERLYPEGVVNSAVNKIMSDTIIQCKYRKRCAGIKRYLEQKMNEVCG